MQHRDIGFGPIEGGEVAWLEPLNCRMLSENRFSRLNHADEWVQRDNESGIAVVGNWKRLPDADIDSQLLNEFPPETILRRFSRMYLASWKFPLKRHARCRAALSGKNETVLFDNGACNLNMFHGNQKYITIS